MLDVDDSGVKECFLIFDLMNNSTFIENNWYWLYWFITFVCIEDQVLYNYLMRCVIKHCWAVSISPFSSFLFMGGVVVFV